MLLGLSLFLTMVLVQPVASEIYQKAWIPVEKGQITMEQGITEGSQPLRNFLVQIRSRKGRQALLGDLPQARAAISSRPRPDGAYSCLHSQRVESRVSDRRDHLLPFLVIDFVVASVTLSVGMVQLPPAMISAPFKILLFVLIDGWNLIVGSLMRSLVTPG